MWQWVNVIADVICHAVSISKQIVKKNTKIKYEVRKVLFREGS